MNRAVPLLALLALACAPEARADEAVAADTARMTMESLDEQRGGLATPFGVDIGFGASVRTYVDGSLALETRLSWTEDGPRTERVFESAAGRDLPSGDDRAVLVAPGTSVIHDLSDRRIASVVLNTANDRSIRQDTDLSLHLPQLPDLQQRIAAERLSTALNAISPQAAGLD